MIGDGALGAAGQPLAAASAAMSGIIGFIVVVVLGIVCVFLFRSMSNQMKKVPEVFPPPDGPADTPGPEATPREDRRG